MRSNFESYTKTNWLLATTKRIKKPEIFPNKKGENKDYLKVFIPEYRGLLGGKAVLDQRNLCSPFFSVFTIFVGRGVEGPVEVILNGVVKFIPVTIQRIARS